MASANNKQGLLGSWSLVAGLTTVSRVLGLVREIAFARFLGAGVVMDAFIVAFRIPGLFRHFFAEGALTQSFIPVYSERMQTGSKEELRILLGRIGANAVPACVRTAHLRRDLSALGLTRFKRAADREAYGSGNHRLVGGPDRCASRHGAGHFLASGSISWLNYSQRLMEFPLGVFGVALATVALPKLSQLHAAGQSLPAPHALLAGGTGGAAAAYFACLFVTGHRWRDAR